MVIVFRWPWAEYGQPFETMPQWNIIMEGIFAFMNEFGVETADMIAHSYGTCIANRVLRRLCNLDAEDGFPAPTRGFRSVRALALLEPMIFGDTSAGLSCAFCNNLGLDINLASLTNRGGVPWKETMFYDPSSRGQCLGGIHIYACVGDAFVDASGMKEFCRKHQPSARFKKDTTRFTFHGRFLCEMWCGASFLSAPCATRVMQLVLNALDPKLAGG